MKKLIGKVVGGKMERTVLVAVESTFSHPLYKKIIKKFKNIKVDNQIGAKKGDLVRIIQTRPISKEKHFKVLEVIKNASDR